MSEQKECKLGDIATFKTGKLNSNAATSDGIYQFFTCSPDTLKIDNYAFDEEALLLAGNNANGIFTLKYFKGKFNAYQRTYIITLNHNSDYKYIFYALKLQLSNLEYISHGTATKFLTLSLLNNIPIFLPPLPEQRAIASVLSSLDDKIDLLHRQNRTLEAMAETLFRQWFIENAEEGWEEGKLADVADFNNGKSRPESIEGSTIPIYGGNGILGYTIRSNSEGMSIVIGRVGAYCGSLYIENRPVWITDNALSAKPKNKKYTSYVYYLLKSLNLNQMAEGSSHPLLTQTLLNTIDITIPSDDIIAAFCGFADSISMKSFFNKTQINTLEKLRDTLLHRLMSGEVKVEI